MAKYTWGQGFEYSATTIPYMIWFVFFYLLGSSLSIKSIENIVLIYGLFYIVMFLFQFTHSDTVYFGVVEEFKEDRGVIRVNFPGGGVFFLSCFIAINKATTESEKRYWWLLYALIGLVVNVLQVTRQTIMVMIVIYLIHFLYHAKMVYKIVFSLIFIFGFFLFLSLDNPISNGLIEQQKIDSSAGGEYIRILCAQYFLTEFTPNTISQIFGNGFFNDTSNYGKALIYLGKNYGYYLSDVGLVEVYITFGIPALIGYSLIFIKSFSISVPSNYYYLKYYLWMLLITCLTSDFLISYYYVITTVLVLYCYQKLYEQQLSKQELDFKIVIK